MLSNCGVGENSWESLYSKEIKPVNPKLNQPWIFIWSTNAETSILWPPYVQSRLLEKTMMLGKIKGRGRGQQRMRWLGGITNLMDMNLSKLQETGEDRGAWRATVHGVSKSQTQLSYWTTTAQRSPDLHSKSVPYSQSVCSIFTWPFHELHWGKGKKKNPMIFHLNIFYQKNVAAEFWKRL